MEHTNKNNKRFMNFWHWKQKCEICAQVTWNFMIVKCRVNFVIIMQKPDHYYGEKERERDEGEEEEFKLIPCIK